MEFTTKLIIETLRYCGSLKGCEACPIRSDFGKHCMKIMLDAADKLEAAQNLIEGKEPSEKQVLDYCRKRYLVIVGKELFQRFNDKGEWIPNSPFTGTCTKCGSLGNLKDKYCANCGKRMK